MLGTLRKRQLFAMIKNVDFNGSVETNPYKFKLYDLSGFSLYVNAKIVPSEGLKLEMDHEKTSVMGYRTLFDRSGKHHSNSEIQVTHMYINCYFMLLFHLMPHRVPRKATRQSPRMAIPGSNCYSANHYPSRHVPAVPSI